MVYTGGPYVSIGTLLSGCALAPINIPYRRVSDSLTDVMDRLYTNFLPWEWWFDYTGALQVDVARGENKAITITAGERLNKVVAERNSKPSAQRVRVTGSGESKEQDDITSSWQEDTIAMDTINSFYEKIRGEKDYTNKETTDILAQVILELSADPREEITISDFDNSPYTADDYDVGDYLIIADATTGLAGLYRVSTIEKTIDTNSGEEVILTLKKKRTDITDRLAQLQKTLDQIQHSNTVLSKYLNFGGKQGNLNPDDMENVWQISSSNKMAFEMPEESSEGADDPHLTFTEVAGGGTYVCNKDEFDLLTDGNNNDDIKLYNTIQSLDWEDDSRFACEFEIDTDGDGQIWNSGDVMLIGIYNTAESLGFGFHIRFDGSSYHIDIVLRSTNGGTLMYEVLPVGGIDIDTKYRVEARVDWDEKIVTYYFGSASFDFGIIGIIPFTKIGGIYESGTGQLLHPAHIRIVKGGVGANRIGVYFYNWRSQAKALYVA